MVRFFELQRDHANRHRGSDRFNSFIGFYFANMYLHMWGLLDHLTLMANRHLTLRLPDNRCSISSKEFWAAMATRLPPLSDFRKEPRVRDWISVMADLRHPAAHKAMLLPTRLVSHTAESQRSDEEVLAILREQEPETFEMFPRHVLDAMIPHMISNWRFQNLKILGDGIVHVQGTSRSYVRPALNSLDHDVALLDEVMDAFIAGLFERSSGLKVSDPDGA